MSGPRGLIIAAAASHSGKTTVSVGLLAVLRRHGLVVSAAKCGPDYLDPRFLEEASGRPAVNLDPWAMGPERVQARLAQQAEGVDLVLIEGVMGLFDGGAGGVGSTASLAAVTRLPVLLVLGGQGTAQTAAAVAEGCARLAGGFSVAGAIVNGIASDRHADLVREGFRRSSVPLLGLLRRDPGVALPSRHLGLVQAEEHEDLQCKIARAAELARAGCDLDAILSLARSITPPPRGEGIGEGLIRTSELDARTHRPRYSLPSPPPQGRRELLAPLGQRIAVARDVAFGFAYPHILGDWRDGGAEISFFSPLADEPPAADADAVFLPGGYPELHAGRLAAAFMFRSGMLAAAERGALVYGECGGYMVMGDALTDAEGHEHRMLGLLPVATSFAQRKLHLGYRKLKPMADLPWAGALSAHEFHFASIVAEGEADRLFEAEAPDGTVLGPMGLRRSRVMGSFMHAIDLAPARSPAGAAFGKHV
jgi:cobyrinic acid a,c-diamide synthase